MLFLKRYRSKPPNAALTLDCMVSKTMLASNLDHTEYRKFLDGIHRDSFNCWDFGKRASKFLERGKVASILCNDVFYFGRIQDIIKDPSGKIGDSVCWSRQYKAPWTNFVIFDDLKKIPSLSERVISELDLLIEKEAVLLDENQQNFYLIENHDQIEELLNFKMHEMLSSKNNRQNVIVRKNSTTGVCENVNEDSTKGSSDKETLKEIEKVLQTEIDALVSWLKKQPEGTLTFTMEK